LTLVCASSADIRAATDEGMKAFNQAFYHSLENAREAHATTGDTGRAA
jgi:hypothetical protein